MVKRRESVNLYRFINSKDIRKHLEDLKYEFNALEAAWLIYQCKDTTLKQRHKSWNWIIENMSDMAVPERSMCIYRESLHETLRQYIAMEDDLIGKFCSEEEGVFTLGRYCDGGTLYDDGWSEAVFFNLDECINKIKEDFEECEETKQESIDDPSYGRFWDSNCPAVVRHFKNEKYRIQVSYDQDCEVRRVFMFGPLKNIKADYLNLMSMFFEGLWFDFPTPFKKGDIVHMINDDAEESYAYAFCRGAFVLEDILSQNLEEEREKPHWVREQGDTTDMTAYGIFLQEDGTIYRECTNNYMDLEYYHGPYKGIRRILKPLSNFVKGEIELELFLYAYRIIVLEQKTEEIRKEFGWYTYEGMRLAGLIKDEI